MNQIDEKEVKSAEILSESESVSVNPRWIEDEEDKHFDDISEAEEKSSRWLNNEIEEEKPKKKRPFIQIPVIISLCLVVASLLAYFGYQLFFIAEPEGVTWVWSSETDNVNWYFEFKDKNVFKAYVGSFEITANYAKDKTDEEISKMTVTADVPYAQSLGCIFFGSEFQYKIEGSRLSGDQKMTISYPEDSSAQEFVLTQTNEHEAPLELPEDFKGDDALTGEWVNIYSSDTAKQTIVFNEDGSMTLAETYTFTDGSFSEIRRNCTYTVGDNEIDITWKAEETVVHHSDYSIKNGILTLDGAEYYRADNNPATADEV